MLQSLSIRNFAIIDRLDVEFETGLNVLTGETGAGKSILIGALEVILGGRAGVEMVRAGTERATIDAVFDLSRSPEALRFIQAIGFEAEDNRLLLTREIASGAKSTARVSGRPAAVSQLKEIGEWLVDLHGQHEHQSLLSVARHLDILDEWGGMDVLAIRAQTGEAYRLLRKLQDERSALERDARERARLVDLYRFQSMEITDAALIPGEEDELKANASRLANAQKLAESTVSTAAGIGGDGGITESLSSLAKALQDAAEVDDRLKSTAESVSSALYGLEEAARELTAYQDSIEHDPALLQQIEERLELISNLKRKYGDTVEEIVQYGEDAAQKLDDLNQTEERRDSLDAEFLTAHDKLESLCSDLSGHRERIACAFADSVVSELRELAMDKTRFEVRIEKGDATPKGIDKIEFLISPNPGEPLKPLAKIASGGEISRVMLAIKSAMARQDPLPTMVFDEIDSGIGGRTASVLGDKLAALSRAAQVICITHLPQIAGRAHAHFYIEKRTTSNRTSVSVSPLKDGGRVEELARMLGGATVTDTVLKHAREMLKAE